MNEPGGSGQGHGDTAGPASQLEYGGGGTWELLQVEGDIRWEVRSEIVVSGS